MKRKRKTKSYPYKFFDCSINDYSNKTHNNISLGPKENDIMADLNRYSNFFDFKRTYDFHEADVIITNTTYPEDILEWSEIHSIPKIKRMDGIYWQDNLKHKNEALNQAALQSDKVIFISKYSKNTLKELYDIEVNNEVILNDVDDRIFYPRKKEGFRLVSSCSNWDREGKRLNELIEFSKHITEEIHLIGKCDRELPGNFIKHGYLDNQYEMAKIISESNIFISLFSSKLNTFSLNVSFVKCSIFLFRLILNSIYKIYTMKFI